jgi:hypothetical protein
MVNSSQESASAGVDGAIAYRVRVGRLHRVHHGVYAVGHQVLTRRGRWMAAVLAAGPRAVLPCGGGRRCGTCAPARP